VRLTAGPGIAVIAFPVQRARRGIDEDNNMQSPDTITLTLEEVDRLTSAALLGAGTREANARPVTASIVAAEAEGLQSHGLLRLPTYCEHVKCGKVDGRVEPVVTSPRASAVVVDARSGFAHPAIDLGFRHLVPAARSSGIAALAVTNSYNCGVVGYHVERLAREGLVALAYVNAPAAIAPWGGRKAFFGTNPIACAVPRKSGAPLVIDQSSSVVARGEVMLHAQQGKPIPEGWALDGEGRPTTDPKAALASGSMLPAGGYKGAGVALMVEIMAAALTGANFSHSASSFADNKGGPPNTGQFFIAVDPAAFAGGAFAGRVESLFAAMCSEPGVRLPGTRREAARTRTRTEGVTIKRALHDDIQKRAKSH